MDATDATKTVFRGRVDPATILEEEGCADGSGDIEGGGEGVADGTCVGREESVGGRDGRADGPEDGDAVGRWDDVGRNEGWGEVVGCADGTSQVGSNS